MGSAGAPAVLKAVCGTAAIASAASRAARAGSARKQAGKHTSISSPQRHESALVSRWVMEGTAGRPRSRHSYQGIHSVGCGAPAGKLAAIQAGIARGDGSGSGSGSLRYWLT